MSQARCCAVGQSRWSRGMRYASPGFAIDSAAWIMRLSPGRTSTVKAGPATFIEESIDNLTESLLIGAVVFHFLERRFPPVHGGYTTGPGNRRAYLADFIAMTMDGPVLSGVMKIVAYQLVVTAPVAWPALGGWPWIAQFGLFFLVNDFGRYWLHRWCHESDLLWRVHRVHHTVVQMDAFSTFRVHILEGVIKYGLLVLPFLAVGLWVGTSPAALEASGPEALRQAYVEEDFEAYYSSLASSEFAALVTTNNIRVGALAFAGGIALLPTALVLVMNGATVGVAWGLFLAAGEQARFWGLILPHGLLELTAVFVAGGAGLANHVGIDRPYRAARAGWERWLVPGRAH